MTATDCPPGLIIAAPASGSGKTLVTLGILRALRNRGVDVASLKVGPDYIDPAFHAAATGRPCGNLDPWAMSKATRNTVARRMADGAGLVVCEGVMGLFDGATATCGSTADSAVETGWPVVLVVDARSQAASAAALVRGFDSHRPDVAIAGVIFNKTRSARHIRLLSEAMRHSLPRIPVLGYVPHHEDLSLPARHLGLVQAGEHQDPESFLEAASGHISAHVDLAAVQALAVPAVPWEPPGHVAASAVPPLGQRIAVARDRAFAFCYDHILHGWRNAGASLGFFSPLLDEGPGSDADAVYLPGGYPELYGGTLAAADGFRGLMHDAVGRGAQVYGECGGYMVLGEAIIDTDGRSHAALGLLPLVTSFADRKRHLGYRRVTTRTNSPLGEAGRTFLGHEFHYSTAIREEAVQPLFHAEDARGEPLGSMGMAHGRVAGSYFHLIDREDV